MSAPLPHEAMVGAIVHKFAHTGLDQEDLFQEAMLALWKAEHTFDQQRGVKFATYASRVINNRLIDIVRRHRAHYEEPLGDLPESPYHIELAEMRQILNQVLANCTPTERAIVNAYLGDLSYDEICQQCAVNKKKVDNTIQKIKKMVKLSDEN